MEKYEELVCSYGTLRGYLHIPQNNCIDCPILLMHGYFSSNRVGPARLYLNLARELEKEGYFSIRFDCYGVGESDGSFSHVTFNSELRDYSNIINYVCNQYNFNKIILIGHSMGANLAIYVTELLFDKIKALILISPDIKKKGGIDQLFNKNQIIELKQKGFTIRKGLLINNTFIENIRNMDKLNTIITNMNNIPSFVIQGKNDELYSLEGAEEVASIFNSKLNIIDHGDHNFLNPGSRMNLFKIIKGALKSIQN